MKFALSTLIFLATLPLVIYGIYLGGAWVKDQLVGPDNILDKGIQKTNDPSWFPKAMKKIGG